MGTKRNITAFIIIGISGAILHFVYDLSGGNHIAAVFAPINESIWEHQKLLYFPTAVYTLVENKILIHKPRNYLIASLVGIVTGIISIITLFYTYSGILGFSVTAVDITLFYVGVLIYLSVRNVIVKNRFLYGGYSDLSAYIILTVLFLMFLLCTFFPPDIALFKEP